MDTVNNILFPFIYDEYESANVQEEGGRDLNIWVMGIKKQYGIVDLNQARELLPCKSTSISINEQSVAKYPNFLVQSGTTWGVIYKDGVIKLPFSYDQVEWLEMVSPHDYYWIAKKKKMWGLLSLKDGKEVIPPLYTGLEVLTIEHQVYMHAKKNMKSGVLTMSNAVLIPFEYDRIETAGDAFITVKKTGNEEKFGKIDKTGNVILPCTHTWEEVFEGSDED